MRRTSKQGYVLVQALDVNRRQGANGRQVREHIIIAEQTLGRRLKRGECVHHIDGDKTNNARSNLLICTNSYHRWLHERMALLYAKEHFGDVELRLVKASA